jgi:predicted DNA-binding transcriptional regulator YafY
LLRLLERYGTAELDAAIREAIARGVPHPNAVRLALEHRRELRNEAPPVAVILPAWYHPEWNCFGYRSHQDNPELRAVQMYRLFKKTFFR